MTDERLDAQGVGAETDPASLHAERGWLLYEIERHGEAAVEAGRALGHDPEHASALRLSVYTQLALDEPGGALTSARELVALYPEWALAHVALAHVLPAQELQTRMDHWAKALALAPDDPWVIYKYAQELTDLFLLRAARRQVLKALQLSPYYTDAYIQLCIISLNHLQVRRARAEVEQALRLSPADHGALMAVQMVRYFEGQRESALIELLALLGEHPHSQMIRGNLTFMLGQYLGNEAVERVIRWPVLNLLLAKPTHWWVARRRPARLTRLPEPLRSQVRPGGGLCPSLYTAEHLPSGLLYCSGLAILGVSAPASPVWKWALLAVPFFLWQSLERSRLPLIYGWPAWWDRPFRWLLAPFVGLAYALRALWRNPWTVALSLLIVYLLGVTWLKRSDFTSLLPYLLMGVFVAYLARWQSRR